MTRGTNIPVEVHWIIIQLSSLLKKEDISIYTGISVHSIERILLYYHAHGTIKVQDSKQQRRRHLWDLDVEASLILPYVPTMI
jgi:hypothetical protein